MHPDTDDFTYTDPSFRHNDSRIDILCVCDKLKPREESCDHVINPCPDHKAVILSVRGEEKQRGKGYWKLIVSILNEESCKETTCKIILDTISEYMHQVDKTMIWELIKTRVKEFIQYCQSRNRKKN